MSSEVPAGGAYKAALGLHESLTVEHLKEARRQLFYYCMGREEFCGEYIRRVSEVSLNVARARLEDLSGSQDYVGVDKEILGLVDSIVRFYADYMSGLLALHGEDVLVEVTGEIGLGENVILRRGEIVVLSPGDAARLAISGRARPVKSNAISLGILQGAGGREG